MHWFHRLSFLVITILLFCGCSSDKSSPTLEASIPSTATPILTTTPLQPTSLPPTPSPPKPLHTPLPPTETLAPTATPNRLPEGVEAVSITTDDGFDLAGFMHIPTNPVSGNMAVVLSHEYYSTHHSWEWLAEKLVGEGFTTLTFDSRGHGESPGPKVYETAGIDTKAAVNFLNQQGFNQVICLGTSMGGSGCLIAAIDMEVAGIAMLSSPMDIGRLRVLSRSELESLTIPKLLMITEEDRVGAGFVAEFIEMTEIVAEPKDIYIYPGDQHAAEMFYFESGDEVREILFDFVTGFSQSAENPPSTNTSFVPALTTEDCTSVGLPGMACTGVSSNDEWEPVIREFDGIPMVLVPAGCFMMGSSDAQIEYFLTLLDRRRIYENEQPAHQICIEQPFWIDLYEVTNGYYGSYGHFRENDQPRDSLTWLEANVYCRERGARLPSEVEWEYAARGPDSLIYPWGNTFDPSRLNYCDTNCNGLEADKNYDDGFAGTAPVGSFPEGASWVGAQDMAGNLWERVSSIMLPYPYDPEDGREASIDQDEISLRGVRGGCWSESSYVVRSTNRNERENTNYSALYGLRCARSFDSNSGQAYTGQNSPTLVYEPPIDAQLGDTWKRPDDGSVMVYVPGGTFQMGTGIAGRTNAGQYEFPEHPVKLNSFWIDKFHVTNKQFAEFLYFNGNQTEGGVPWLEMGSEFCLIDEYLDTPMPKIGFEQHPVVDVSWYGANAYCDWVGGRLPTEAEWEYAASGPDNLIYPWGNEYDCTKGNFLDWTDEDEPVIFTWRGARGCDGIDHTSQVDAYPEGASWVGALDMAGNVWDWVSDWGLAFYPTGLETNPTGPETGTEKVVRGGSWNNQETGVRTTMRGDYRPINRSAYIGFRCVYDASVDEKTELKEQNPKTTEKSGFTAEDCLAVGVPESACAGVANNDDWIPVTREFDGVPMTLVPAGCFMMGNEDSFSEMQPVHKICSEHPFWIDLTEVTVGQFANFLNGQDQPIDNYDPWLDVWGVTFDPPIQLKQDNGHWYPLFKEENRPLQSVIWVGAYEFCAWRNARLPSEAEWEYAARGPDNLLYPWGNEFKRDRIVRYEGQNPEVGSKPQGASWVGALDMVGSLFEWTNSLYMPYPYHPFDGREASFEANKGDRVFRGSAWYHPEWWNDDLSATARFDARPDIATWYFGFRCARDFSMDDLVE